MAGTDATAILIIVPIDHVVATLDGQVPPVDLEHTLRAGLLRRAAGETVSDFQRTLAALFVRAVPLDDERLAHVRKIEITVQFRGRPDLTGFDTSVVCRGMLDKMRLAPVPGSDSFAPRTLRQGSPAAKDASQSIAGDAG